MIRPTHRLPRSFGPEAHAQGFSLIELLLALALGLIVVTGIVQLFVGNSQTYAILNGQARMQENGRFAMDFIARAARSAGYLGCAKDPANLILGLTANTAGGWAAIPEVDVSLPVQGFDNVVDENDLATLPTSGDVDIGVRFSPDPGTAEAPFGMPAAVTTDRTIDGVWSGTDVLVLSGAREPGVPLAEVLQPTGAPVVAAPGGVSPVQPNDIVVISSCEQAAVVRVTDVSLSGDDATLELALGDTGSEVGQTEQLYRNAAEVMSPTGTMVPFTLSLIGRSYGEDTIVSPVESNFFYIAPGAGLANDGNPPLALWQKQGTARPVELVQGIEDLQVLFGIDTTLNDGIANANQYVTASAVTDPTQIVAVRVSLTANSVDTVDGDEPLRRTFTRTFLVRNANPEL